MDWSEVFGANLYLNDCLGFQFVQIAGSIGDDAIVLGSKRTRLIATD